MFLFWLLQVLNVHSKFDTYIFHFEFENFTASFSNFHILFQTFYTCYIILQDFSYSENLSWCGIVYLTYSLDAADTDFPGRWGRTLKVTAQS